MSINRNTYKEVNMKDEFKVIIALLMIILNIILLSMI